jgi:glycosyltransferase involved in cell wall biosynthesis
LNACKRSRHADLYFPQSESKGGLPGKKRVKVLHLINTLSTGGAELHLLALCRQLRRRGVETAVACLREQVRDSRSLRCDFENDGIRVLSLEADGRYDLRSITRLGNLVAKERPDILHTHLPRADAAGIFARLLHPTMAWVCSVHGIYSVDWSGRWTLPFFNFLWQGADRVVAISHAVRDWLVKERSLPDRKIAVIHYGIESERFWKADSDLRAKFGLGDKFIIGTIGRLEPRKGHEYLIEAINQIRNTIPSAALVIAGHDPWKYGPNLQALTDRLDLREHVKFVGFQNDIPAFLSALDIFAFATTSEGFGQVVVEAMAAGKPVVTSKIPPLTEIVVDGETGLLVEPEKPDEFARAMHWLLTHPEEGHRMGNQGRERVKNCFTAEKMAEETLLLYNEVLCERTAKRSLTVKD